MWSMFRSLSLATACVASVEEMAFDDESLSLIQLRASGHHRSQWNPGDPLWLHPSVTESPYGKKKANGEYGNEVKERPKVDDYKCDTSHLVPGVAWVLDKPMQNCKVEMKDDSLGAIRDGPGDVITGVRFYAAQAGNNGLRFRVYRQNGKLSEQSEEIDVPVAGVIQEVTFKKPMLFLFEDSIGWSFNGKGNMAYSEEPVFADNPSYVTWRDGSSQRWDDPADNAFILTWQQEQHGNCDYYRMKPPTQNRVHGLRQEQRTYSYSLITRPASKDDLPEKICYNDGGLKAIPPPQSLIDTLPDAVDLPDPVPPAATTPLPTSEEGCRDLATQWGMELGGGGFAFSGGYSNKGCYTYKSGAFACKAFYGKGGDEAAQLRNFPADDKLSRLGSGAQAQCAPNWTPPGDEASATGDPHLITNTGKHYDYTTK